MAVHFEFRLEDTDAETMISILRKEQQDTKLLSLREKDPVIAAWFLKHSDYIEGIIKTILDGNKRVE